MSPSAAAASRCHSMSVAASIVLTLLLGPCLCRLLMIAVSMAAPNGTVTISTMPASTLHQQQPTRHCAEQKICHTHDPARANPLLKADGRLCCLLSCQKLSRLHPGKGGLLLLAPCGGAGCWLLIVAVSRVTVLPDAPVSPACVVLSISQGLNCSLQGWVTDLHKRATWDTKQSAWRTMWTPTVGYLH